MTDIVEEDKIIGTAKIRRQITRGLVVSLPMDLVRKYNLTEVIFDFKKLLFREATIFDNKTYKISVCTFGIAYLGYEHLEGEYNVIKEDGEDEFYLKRINK